MVQQSIAFVWDLDDTLYQQSQQFINTTKKMYPELDFNGDKLYRRFKYFSDETYDEFLAGVLTTEEMRRKRIRKTMQELAVEMSEEEAEDWQQLYLSEQQSLYLDLQIQHILRELTARGIPLGIISNGPSEHQRRKIKALGLEQWIPESNTVISGDVSIDKPDEAIFQTFLNKSGLDRAEIYYIGDNYVNDIQGSKNFGWKNIWLNYNETSSIPHNNLANYVVTSYEELTDIIFQQILK